MQDMAKIDNFCDKCKMSVICDLSQERCGTEVLCPARGV